MFQYDYKYFQSRAGSVSAVDVLKVAEAYLNEKDYTVWNDLSLNMSGVSIPLQYTDSCNDFKRYTRDLFRPIATELGWEAKDGEGKGIIVINRRLFRFM